MEERISKNVAQLVKVQRARRKRPDPWSVEEACTFLENAQTWRDYLYAAYVLILVLGLRKGEVLGLTWSDVNLDTGELHVRHQLQRVRRRLLHTDTAKTEASEAVLPLPDVCLTALRLRRKEQETARERAKDLWTESDLVFTTRYGTPVEPRNFTREFDRRCDRAEVRRIRVHDTRHTCASLLAALDVHPRIAMQILRHSEIAVTMEVYTHVPSAETRRALRKLGKALGGGSKHKDDRQKDDGPKEGKPKKDKRKKEKQKQKQKQKKGKRKQKPQPGEPGEPREPAKDGHQQP
ncbi:site-specific integrase [Streptomyces odontomachi]|uniref:site-specific integrase n=1 Tax=Streptomyces odontomachi TaxID=2944940 RepID=UPI0027E36DD2|nr:site-specific integrase [Streptomyces sp. ODS25]